MYEYKPSTKQKDDGTYSTNVFTFKLVLPKYSATLIFEFKPSRFGCASNYTDLHRFPGSKATGSWSWPFGSHCAE